MRIRSRKRRKSRMRIDPALAPKLAPDRHPGPYLGLFLGVLLLRPRFGHEDSAKGPIDRRPPGLYHTASAASLQTDLDGKPFGPTARKRSHFAGPRLRFEPGSIS